MFPEMEEASRCCQCGDVLQGGDWMEICKHFAPFCTALPPPLRRTSAAILAPDAAQTTELLSCSAPGGGDSVDITASNEGYPKVRKDIMLTLLTLMTFVLCDEVPISCLLTGGYHLFSIVT